MNTTEGTTMKIKSVSGKNVSVRIGMLVWLGNQTGRIVALGNETARVQVGIVVHKGVTCDRLAAAASPAQRA